MLSVKFTLDRMPPPEQARSCFFENTVCWKVFNKTGIFAWILLLDSNYAGSFFFILYNHFLPSHLSSRSAHKQTQPASILYSQLSNATKYKPFTF